MKTKSLAIGLSILSSILSNLPAQPLSPYNSSNDMIVAPIEDEGEEGQNLPGLRGKQFSPQDEENGMATGELEEEPAGAPKEEKTSFGDMIEFGGAIEVEAGWSREFDKSRDSGVALEAAEIDFEVTLTDWAKGFLSFELFNEVDDHNCGDHFDCNCLLDKHYITVKEAFITLGKTRCFPPFFTAGRLFVPFGTGSGAVIGDTLSISDPLTIEIFETREDVLMLGYEFNGFMACGYVFDGCSNRGGRDDHLDQYGACLRYEQLNGKDFFRGGIDFISNVFDSDELQKSFPTALKARNAPGIALHTNIHKNNIYFTAEYNAALRSSYFLHEEAFLRLRPKAWQVELGFDLSLCNNPGYFALNYSRSSDLQGIVPRSRFLATMAFWLYKDEILLGIEYGKDYDYSESKGGTGNIGHSWLAQLTYEW